MINVIIPHYKHQCYLPDLIESYMQQSLDDWHLTIYNDDPDIKLNYYFRLDDFRIDFKNFFHNKGQSIRWNQGIGEAKSDIIAFQGADDIALSWKISSIADHMENADVLYTDAVQLMPNGKRLYIKGRNFDSDLIKEKNFIVASTVAVWREFLMDTGIRFDEDLRYGEDWVFYNRLANAGARFRYLPWPTIYYREYTSNIKVRYGEGWEEKKSALRERIAEIYK